MSDNTTVSQYIEVYVVCEGQTERDFVNRILREYFAPKNIGLTGTLCDRYGGNVKFDRFAQEIYKYLKARPNVYVTTFVDFYGVNKNWPGLEEALCQNDVEAKARVFCEQTKIALQKKYDLPNWERFIPYVSMFEFEALLFSDADILAETLKIDVREVQKILAKYESPEEIDNSPATAPSKRLENLTSGKYKKIADGLKIAERLGIDATRKRCAVFNRWIATLERLRSAD